MTYTIKTNHAWRDLVPFTDLPEKVRRDFDYITDDAQWEDRFVCYKGTWYDVLDSMAVRGGRGGSDLDVFAGWDSYIGDSFFSGVLFRLERDGVRVQCGTYFC